jgi:hypothetical protein
VDTIEEVLAAVFDNHHMENVVNIPNASDVLIASPTSRELVF